MTAHPADRTPAHPDTTSPAPGRRPVLELDGVVLDIADGAGRRRLLDRVDLSVGAGEILGVTGPSGSGKSTLLAVAGALATPDAGRAVLHAGGRRIDLAVDGAAAARIRRGHIGLVFQQDNLIPALRVREQLELMTRLDRVLPPSRAARRAARERAGELLDAVGLGDLGERRVGALSGGQRARVNLARALMNRPELILADEPTAALDRESAARVTELLGRVVREAGAAALYVTHDLGQLHIADRTVELVDGRVTEPAPAIPA
ncbi:ABC transporter ATP-binding protein [Corynebacterium sphenisci]|uniref:ABC transporter ATP-binding protein n=1 Tax=Corynebacterium sphenisci TaxID=191493 RepID=UPI0026E06CEF|nr:ATP-binding cassette domain-containing protein [Corynebacterium sphenisci]MDO5730285.1 ATP-binding cassette domain-containing protein [Corynebacterium sphenisci]